MQNYPMARGGKVWAKISNGKNIIYNCLFFYRYYFLTKIACSEVPSGFDHTLPPGACVNFNIASTRRFC